MAALPEGMEKEVIERLRARDCDAVFETLSRLILSERLQVGREALDKLVGAVGLARSGMEESPGPGYKPH